MSFCKLQLTIIYNTLKALGVPVSTLLLGVILLALYGVSRTSQLEILGIYASIIILFHFNRGDKFLLSILYRKKSTVKLMLEYTALALPFVFICLLKNYFWGIVGCIVLAAVIPLIPNCNIGIRIYTHPFLIRGSYQYQNSMRILLAPYTIAFAVSVLGLIYENVRILQVCVILFIFLLGFLICQPLQKQYILFYASAIRIIKLQLLYAFGNSFVLLLPFILAQMIYEPSLSTLSSGIKILFLSALFFYQSECVRFLNLGNDLLNMIVLTALFFLLSVCYMQILVIPCVLIVTVILSIYVYKHK